MVSEKALKQVPEVKTLKDIPDPQFQTPEPKPKTLIDFKAPDFKLLEGLIFLEARKNYDMALAYFAELFADKDLGLEARYHFAELPKSED